MEKLDEILQSKPVTNSSTVNSIKKEYIPSVNGSTVNSTTVDSSHISKRIEELLEQEGTESEGIAKTIAEQLDDVRSLRYYELLVQENSAGRLFEAVSITKDASLRGRIRTTKAVYFQAIIRRWGLKTKFRKDG